MSIDNLQNEVVKAPFSRRVGVAITDLFILLFTFLIFNTYILSPIVASTTTYTKATDEYKEVLLDSNLYILNESKKDTISQRSLKNTYFINFCYMLGSYLYYRHHIGINDENTTYSSGMLSYQDINAFTKVFEKYPYLIFMPIDEISMNLLGELYNKQQEAFKNR